MSKIKINDKELREKCVTILSERGVEIKDIAEITYEIQKQYYPDLTLEECIEHVNAVLDKREVTHAVITGLNLDMLAEQGHLVEPLSTIMLNDYPLYGIDEVLAYSIVNVYGSIGLTNFGYVDKIKPGIIGRIDELGKETGNCNTYLDDIIGAIAAAAASRIAHTRL
ncbi:phosphatidylglycerophosphatase A family protein [Haloplasma contractile]|uniref:Phosphatidylglycerophosphatase A protein n=1 Tax=Haloplasma contractile SSD-17B TaxID=1033810 RepID=U2DYP9_9MOLU|nr:phosphatidylglycerophosphatase A [Haloplasma contractile]ERJ13372.1 phosphatidylglycerophosphatase A protein [Haloplasma contractile SSD-17B]